MNSPQTDRLGRRGFVVLGVTGVASIAGCLDRTEDEPASVGGGSVSDDSTAADDDADENSELPDAFDFPSGADETGADPGIVLSNARNIVASTSRYRLEQDHEIAYRGANDVTVEITSDVEGEKHLERRLQNDVEVERWIVPERTVARSGPSVDDETGRWVTEASSENSPDGFHVRPFADATPVEFLKHASLEFDEIVTRDETMYARYSGDVQFDPSGTVGFPEVLDSSVRHDVESISGGTVTVLLAETGAIRRIDYTVPGEVRQTTHDSRDVLTAEMSGSLRLQYDDLSVLKTPEWVSDADPDEFVQFEIQEGRFGKTYDLVDGPDLPGSMDLWYARFYVHAWFGDDHYLTRYRQSHDFEVDDSLHVHLSPSGDELLVDRLSITGRTRNAFEEADRIEIGVSLWAPGESHVPLYYEDRSL